MTISAYDRHGSDEHSALSEEQLNEQIDAGDQIDTKPAPSGKVVSKKTTTKNKVVQKSIAKKSTKKPHDWTLDGNVQPQPDNEYVFTVTATSPDGTSVEQKVTLRVQDRNDEVQQGKIGTDTYLHLGAGDYLEVVDDDGQGWSSITGDTSRTLESWVRINNKASDAKPTVLFAYGNADESGKEGQEWFIIEMSDAGLLQLNTNINSERDYYTADHARIDDNAWVHIAVTYDGKTLKIWLNQENVLSVEVKLNTTDNASLRLGDSTHLFPDDGGKNGSVDFDNFRFWDKALTPEEIIASSRIHKYGSPDLNDSDAGFAGIDGLKVEFSFDQLKSTSDDGRNALRGEDGDDELFGGAGDDGLSGGAGDDTLYGGAGADKFMLDKRDAGTDIIADFSVSDGDKIQSDADKDNDKTLAGLGLAVADNGAHANIVDAINNARIYLTLHNIDHADITDTNFDTYFEVI